MGTDGKGLEVHGATVRFDGKAAIEDVDLTLASGHVLAVLGPSGCGKSTLLRAIAGLEELDAGTIAFDGRDLAGVPTHKRGFALMFQDGQLFPHQTVAGNVGYALRLRGRSRAHLRERVEELLELVGLPGYGDRMPATLSSQTATATPGKSMWYWKGSSPSVAAVLLLSASKKPLLCRLYPLLRVAIL